MRGKLWTPSQHLIPVYEGSALKVGAVSLFLIPQTAIKCTVDLTLSYSHCQNFHCSGTTFIGKKKFNNTVTGE